MIPRFRYALVLLSISGSLTVPALAQFTTAWPAPESDIGRYETVFECLAATARIAGSALERRVRRDTLPLSPDDVLRPLSPDVPRVARQCSERYHASDVPLSEVEQWIKLFLQANRDEDARIVAQRWLATALPDDRLAGHPIARQTSLPEESRGHRLYTIAHHYLQARPIRLAAAEPLVHEFQQLGNTVSWFNRVSLAARLQSWAEDQNDTVRARRAAEWVTAVSDQLTEADRAHYLYAIARQDFLAAFRYLSYEAGLDSLRRSNASYLALQHSFDRRLLLNESLLGGVAPELQGEFWFPNKPDTPPPAAGHITLIIAKFSPSLAEIYETSAMLRRFKQRFPALDIVISTKTEGYFGPAVPPQPPEEAEIRRQWIQDFHRFPATVVVETTPFWRLEAPDRRRINVVTPNVEQYGPLLWIVDRDRTILYAGPQSRLSERDCTDILAILFARE